MSRTPLLLALALASLGACRRNAEDMLLTPAPAPEGPAAPAVAAAPAAAAAPVAPARPAAPAAPTARPAAPGPAAGEVHAAHVLIMYRGSERAPATVTRSQAEARTLAAQVLTRARAGEDFAGLARQFSDEPGAAARGGDLGNFGRGRMVPPFDAAAFALAVGGISDVVETPFGYHVIKRLQ